MDHRTEGWELSGGVMERIERDDRVFNTIGRTTISANNTPIQRSQELNHQPKGIPLLQLNLSQRIDLSGLNGRGDPWSGSALIT